MKKIVSPPDIPQNSVPQAQTNVHVADQGDAIPDVSGDDVPGPMVENQSESFGNDMTDDQIC